MLLSHSFSNRNFISVLFLATSWAAFTTADNKQPLGIPAVPAAPATVDFGLTQNGAFWEIDCVITGETEHATYFSANIKNDKKQEIGSVFFHIYKMNQTGYIGRLHVTAAERKQSYGSILLKFALNIITQCGSKAVYWQAYPFDLQNDQTKSLMLPKLIAFYKRHGAQVLSSTGTSAEMAYYPEAPAAA